VVAVNIQTTFPLLQILIETDLHEYLTGPSAVPVTPHPITGAKLPTTLGHEFSGTVEEIGEGVVSLKVGDRVAIKPNLSDGSCSRCAMGRQNICSSLGFIGYSSMSRYSLNVIDLTKYR
jgi:threonine dehydrogenase-like Zn-dependent dehydrogenase